MLLCLAMRGEILLRSELERARWALEPPHGIMHERPVALEMLLLRESAPAVGTAVRARGRRSCRWLQEEVHAHLLRGRGHSSGGAVVRRSVSGERAGRGQSDGGLSERERALAVWAGPLYSF